LPSLLDVVGIEIPADVEGISHANNLLRPTADAAPVRQELFTEKTYHDSFDPMRAIRTKEYSYIENYAPPHLVDLPLDVQDSPSGKAVALFAAEPRPARELYDLLEDPTELNNLLVGDERDRSERIANELALRLHQWRERTGDVCPSVFAGPRILIECTETYLGLRTNPGHPAYFAFAERDRTRLTPSDRLQAIDAILAQVGINLRPHVMRDGIVKLFENDCGAVDVSLFGGQI
jgi:hypothetical protein